MKQYTLLFLFPFLFANAAHAQEAIPIAYDVFTKETIIEVNGKKYRKVEYKGEYFYMRLLEPESDASALEFSCSEKPSTQMENQIYISTTITKRSSLFIEGLRQTCSDLRSGKAKATIDPNIQIGFVFKDSSSSKIKNKKIFWNPLSGLLGVGGEW